MTENKQPKRLYRSRKDRVIAGICGGIADYFNIDPVFIRVLFIVFLLLAGLTLAIYFLMWLIVPLRPEDTSSTSDTSNTSNTSNISSS